MARKLMAAFYSSASNKRVLAFLGVGFLVGMALGFIAMGTIHAVIEVGAGKQQRQGEGSGLIADMNTGGAGRLVRGAGAARVTLQRRQQQDTQRQARLAASQQAAAAQQAAAQAQRAAAEQAAGAQVVGSWPTKGDTIHVLCTSNGSPYLNFQTRIMYATFQLVQKQPGGEKLVAFTRILHRTKPDVLMQEVPTFRSDPLTPQCDEWCEYPVSDRPNAVRQFFDAVKRNASLVKAPWIYMTEADYVWMRPLLAPPAEVAANKALLFPFGYIQPTHPNAAKVMVKFYPASRGPLSDIPNSGPAPALMRVEQWFKVMPHWESITAKIEADPEAKEALGWVREMYAFSLACALAKIPVDLTPPPGNKLIAQPPADRKMGEASQAHYTWGSIIKDSEGRDVWQFDKRTYTGKELETHTPYITEPPPLQAGWKLQDGVPVDAELHATLLAMIKQMNLGVYNLKDIVPAVNTA